MSIQAVAWVLDWSEATLADRLVLIVIASHADGLGMNAWPAIDRIAAEARVDRSTVFRSIERLEARGELAVLRRPGRSNYYGIIALMGSQDATGEGVANCDPGVASTRQRGRRLRPKPLRTVNEPSRAPAHASCWRCGSPLEADACPCSKVPDVSQERAVEIIRALRRGEKPA